jgi:hypothetical protein
MIDQREYIARLESAQPEELMRMLRSPTGEEDEVLRTYLEENRYHRLRTTARTSAARAAAAEPKGNVVVIPGWMGSELTAFSPGGAQEPIWLNVPRIMAGRFGRLRLGDDGRNSFDRHDDVRPSGILKRYYGEILLATAARWKVRAFWYDWRKDLDVAADQLYGAINEWFGRDRPVHIVAHSSGGLVARAFIRKYPKRWEAMWDGSASSPARAGGRLVMLGTPNHGTFQALLAITGLAATTRKLARLDRSRDLGELLQVFHSFPQSYQLLPSPFRVAGAGQLYHSETYGYLNVPQTHLDRAKQLQSQMKKPMGAERMVYVAGCGRPTYAGVRDYERIHSLEDYRATTLGDGYVTHELGLLDGVSTYYVEEEHSALTANPNVLAALDQLLEEGRTEHLSEQPTPAADEEGARKQLLRDREPEERRVEELRNLEAARPEASHLSVEERQAGDVLTRDLLSPRQALSRRQQTLAVSMRHPTVEVGMVFSPIEEIGYEEVKSANGHPIDAIAVGHYLGVRPRGSELGLDQAISRKFLRRPEGGGEVAESDLLLTQYSERGILRGELGQPFFLPDPRDPSGRRVIAIIGMGMPGRFGTPELTVLARELCWAVGRMGKRHLAVASIGTRYKNLGIAEAISAWIRGLKNAITGAIEDEERHIDRLTFAFNDPRMIAPAQAAILADVNRLRRQRRLEIRYEEMGTEELDRLGGLGLDWDRREFENDLARRRQGDRATGNADAPTRVTLSLEGGAYHFGAISESASVPERSLRLDPALVGEANAKLAAEADPDRQLERGRFLERLLVPNDLRGAMATNAPLVMMLDATTARIHWEMVAQSDRANSDNRFPATPSDGPSGGEFDRKFEFADYYLGTSRGLTRQLRSTFSPPPEPPPPPRRVLRILVVANPAADAPLPGAEREGHEIADVFEAFNSVYESHCESRVDVVRLIGPAEATRTDVLEHLMLRAFDVLHFAGHCFFNEQDPSLSGWVFGRNQCLSAYELNRIDRIPKFVFSNACQSGVTPDRTSAISPGLAPSFAEAFFARGVTNFVCTAWSVDDTAALEFSLRLYQGLLGLRPRIGPGPRYEPAPLEPIHEAMKQARLEIASQPHGVRTWGAYQHYGNPYYRLFDLDTMGRSKSDRRVAPGDESQASGNGQVPGRPAGAGRRRRGGKGIHG